jgi:hypothetical protein
MAAMNRRTTKLIREGDYVIEVDIELSDSAEGRGRTCRWPTRNGWMRRGWRCAAVISLRRCAWTCLPADGDERERVGPPEESVRQLRQHETTGRPLGADRFVSRLERIVGRSLRPAKVGRKPNALAK